MKITNLDVELRSKLSHNPLGSAFLTGYDRMMEFIGGDIVIQGSYNTSNIGDLAIGQVIKEEMEKRGFKVHLNGIIYSNQGPPPTFKKYDIHIIGGGGVIRDYPNEKYLLYRLHPIDNAKKSLVIGVGADKIKTNIGRKLIRKLEKTAFITVRDEKSKEILQPLIEKEIIVTACPAFLLQPYKKDVKIKKNKQRIGINLRALPSPKSTDYFYSPKKIDYSTYARNYYHFVKKTLPSMILRTKNDIDYFFIPFSREDIIFAKRYFRNMPLKILSLHPPSKTLSIVATMDKMICMRYHSLIFSIISETPMHIISYHNKVEELVKKLNNFYGLNLFGKYKEKYHIEFNDNKSDIKKVKKDMIAKAITNFSLFDKFLKED